MKSFKYGDLIRYKDNSREELIIEVLESRGGHISGIVIIDKAEIWKTGAPWSIYNTNNYELYKPKTDTYDIF